MGWDAKDIGLLIRLWSAGHSAAQIARRLGCSRNAVCGMLTRQGLKRGHKLPTATPKIRPTPKLRATSWQLAPVQSQRRSRGTRRRGSSPSNSASSSFTRYWLRRSKILAKRSPRMPLRCAQYRLGSTVRGSCPFPSSSRSRQSRRCSPPR
ncbi:MULTISPECIES: GcrA family cell cycle regulator [unclassified Bradyrhizobium]|uniref:GcrA family cell cycle regulator n=1 Tax=unclassified Bradyrhizobium TaxID=2631580 RepID=UPI001FD8C8F0|nr:GcrA family cell cycle regulator [Bradyrhizobium sp. WSM1253]